MGVHVDTFFYPAKGKAFERADMVSMIIDLMQADLLAGPAFLVAGKKIDLDYPLGTCNHTPAKSFSDDQLIAKLKSLDSDKDVAVVFGGLQDSNKAVRAFFQESGTYNGDLVFLLAAGPRSVCAHDGDEFEAQYYMAMTGKRITESLKGTPFQDIVESHMGKRCRLAHGWS